MTGVFRTSDERVTVVEEKSLYPDEELVADIGNTLSLIDIVDLTLFSGGSLGFFLGLSILKLISLMAMFCMKIQHYGLKLKQRQMQREKFKPEKTIKKITKKVIPLKNVEISKNDDLDDSSSIGISKGTSHLE